MDGEGLIALVTTGRLWAGRTGGGDLAVLTTAPRGEAAILGAVDSLGVAENEGAFGGGPFVSMITLLGELICLPGKAGDRTLLGEVRPGLLFCLGGDTFCSTTLLGLRALSLLMATSGPGCVWTRSAGCADGTDVLSAAMF